MSSIVKKALEEQLEKRIHDIDYVFCSPTGLPVNHRNFTNRVWHPLLKELGFRKRRPYQTRHTAATLWLAAGESPEWIARQLGHTTTKMLFTVYSRYVPNLTRQDGSAMDRLLSTQISL
jgi:integrase